MMKFRKARTIAAIAFTSATVCACGGGGGDSGGGSPPPPPPAALTYTVQLVDAGLQDTATGLSVEATGLPLNGATARRN
jgi:hypothetical protein